MGTQSCQLPPRHALCKQAIFNVIASPSLSATEWSAKGRSAQSQRGQVWVAAEFLQQDLRAGSRPTHPHRKYRAGSDSSVSLLPWHVVAAGREGF